MRVFLLSTSSLFAFLVLAQAQELTLQDAVRLGLQQNYTVKNADLDVLRAKDTVAGTRTRMLPAISLYALGSEQLRTIDFTFQRGLLGVYDNVGPIPNNDIRVRTPRTPTGFFFGRVSQPISTLYRIHLNLEVLRTNTRLAEEQARQQRLDVKRNIRQVYYSIQQSQSALTVTAETLKLYQELDRITTGYVEQKTALKSDLLQIKTRLAQAEQQQLTQSDDIATRKEKLNQLLGRDVLTEFSVTPVDVPGSSEANIEAARAAALRDRPELRLARLKAEQARQDVRAKRSEYIPDIAAEFNSLSLINFNGFIPVQSNSVGFSLSWEVFDWGRKRHEVAAKQRVVDQSGNTIKDAVAQVTLDVNDKFRKLREALALIRVASLSREAALEALRVTKDRYEFDSSLLKDVLQAQAALQQANDSYQQALLGVWNARAEFERATGEDQ